MFIAVISSGGLSTRTALLLLGLDCITPTTSFSTWTDEFPASTRNELPRNAIHRQPVPASASGL